MYIKVKFVFKFFRISSTHLNSNFDVPHVRRMVFDEYEERGETQARVNRKVSRKQDALHLTESMSWQCKV